MGGDPPHREGASGPAAPDPDHRPLEDLHPLLVSLSDPEVHPHHISRAKLGNRTARSPFPLQLLKDQIAHPAFLSEEFTGEIVPMGPV